MLHSDPEAFYVYIRSLISSQSSRSAGNLRKSPLNAFGAPWAERAERSSRFLMPVSRSAIKRGRTVALIKRRMRNCYYQHLILIFRFLTQPRSAIRLLPNPDTVETETPPCFVLFGINPRDRVT